MTAIIIINRKNPNGSFIVESIEYVFFFLFSLDGQGFIWVNPVAMFNRTGYYSG